MATTRILSSYRPLAGLSDACEAFTGKITGLHLLLLDPPSGYCLGADTAGTTPHGGAPVSRKRLQCEL
ncbi:hypothetical protein FVEN_g13208 [Fusarium venenatum]|nr:hypothetical protein FVEN_g13208 [Fusarium venenatum]